MLAVLQLIQLKLLAFFNTGSDPDVLLVQNIPHMLQALEGAAACLENYLAAGGSAEQVASFEAYNAACLLALAAQVALLGDSDELQLRLKHRLAFLPGRLGAAAPQGPLKVLADAVRLLDDA